MNTFATENPSLPSGGTPPISPQNSSHEDNQHFLHRQSPRELVRAISSLSKDNEQLLSTRNSSHSSCRSPSSPVLQYHTPSASLNPQESSSQTRDYKNTDQRAVPPEVSFPLQQFSLIRSYFLSSTGHCKASQPSTGNVGSSSFCSTVHPIKRHLTSWFVLTDATSESNCISLIHAPWISYFLFSVDRAF